MAHRRLPFATVLAAAVCVFPVAAADPTTEELEQRVKILERKAEIEAEQAAERAKAAEKATANAKDGFTLRSADGAFVLKIRGYAHFDGRFVGNEPGHPFTDTFVLRRVRPIVEGTVHGRFGFRIMPDFGEGKTALQDAYAEARFRPSLQVRAGKFKAPVGLERLQSATDIAFVERALPTNLVPNRDLGIQVSGEVAGGKLEYAAGIFNGVSDGSSADADTNETKDGVARLFARPIPQVGFGIAATRGTQTGTLAAPGLASFKSASQTSFFAWRSGTTLPATVVADGRHTRVAPQAYVYAGPFGALAEYVRSTQDVRLGAETASLSADSWQVTLTWEITGENASYKGVTPRKPIGPTPGAGRGTWELVGRYGVLTVDRDAFPVYANPATQSRKAQEAALGINWWLNRNYRWMLGVHKTTFEGGASAGDRPDETAILTRVQVAF